MSTAEILKQILLPSLWETIYMVFVATLFSIVIGFIPAIILVITDENGLKPNKIVYKILDFIINMLRSFPFLILMIAIFPFTKLLTGKQIGTTAAIVPLTIGAFPFAARVIESSLKEVNKGIIEAAKSFGSSNFQIIFRVMIKEAMPSIVLGITLTVINIIGYSAMAGAIGGGGLGAAAMQYGYNMFNTTVMVYTVIILMIIVQILQSIGNFIYKMMIK
ncbi:methionine ABC transporter permease [Clostridium felsineum]|uniref:Methionine import system permease protein MetP n=1 Tax=Clostridium felsineum TaxID=36839 RepID=A0A1S8LJK0_9CLOT|nr:methionine ABC transporter permease [Clostridium felsineum]URZ05774.1 Methionine import system permease protein MetP [Clostridium felsineum]URZ10813.1 Methionine import system permease protein MetP [Clostridium felsineum]